MKDARSYGVLLLCVLLCACGDSPSPTEPLSLAAIAGTWTGGLQAFPAGENWTRVRLTLTASENALSGTLTDLFGVVHRVTARSEAMGFVLDVHDLPADTPPCTVSLIVTRVTAQRMEGRLSGRCPNTLASDFTLERVP